MSTGYILAALALFVYIGFTIAEKVIERRRKK